VVLAEGAALAFCLRAAFHFADEDRVVLAPLDLDQSLRVSYSSDEAATRVLFRRRPLYKLFCAPDLLELFIFSEHGLAMLDNQRALQIIFLAWSNGKVSILLEDTSF